MSPAFWPANGNSCRTMLCPIPPHACCFLHSCHYERIYQGPFQRKGVRESFGRGVKIVLELSEWEEPDHWAAVKQKMWKSAEPRGPRQNTAATLHLGPPGQSWVHTCFGSILAVVGLKANRDQLESLDEEVDFFSWNVCPNSRCPKGEGAEPSKSEEG